MNEFQLSPGNAETRDPTDWAAFVPGMYGVGEMRIQGKFDQATLLYEVYCDLRQLMHFWE